jgi:hypothetical protein
MLLIFKCFSQTHMILTIGVFCKYGCIYGPYDHCNDPNHARLIKWGCLATFSIKQMYTWADVVELRFTIKHTLEQMVNQHMAQGIPNH